MSDEKVVEAIKEGVAATEVTAKVIEANTSATAEATSAIAEHTAPAVPFGASLAAPIVPAVKPPTSGTAEAAVANIAAIVRAGDGMTPAASKAGAGIVADITAARRKNAINLLWEGTQAFLALALTSAAIIAAFLFHGDVPSVLTNALFVVLGFYFGRTNHARPTPTMPLGGEDVGGEAASTHGKRE